MREGYPLRGTPQHRQDGLLAGRPRTLRPIDQLARLCLIAAAARQEHLVDHELVEAVMATEWQAPQAAGR